MYYNPTDNHLPIDYTNVLRKNGSGDYSLENISELHGRRRLGYYKVPQSVELKKDIIEKTDLNTKQCFKAIEATTNIAITSYNDSSIQLKERAKHINLWKCELENTNDLLLEQIKNLSEKCSQIKSSFDALYVVESIAKECYELRQNRIEPKIVDDTQKELDFEMILLENVRKLNRELLQRAERQVESNHAAKQLLEYDWSGKTTAYETETMNIQLSNKSNNIRFYPGATRLSDSQSNVESWEKFTIDIIRKCEEEICESTSCCKHIEITLMNSARDLIKHNHKVNKCLEQIIAYTDNERIKFENQLKLTLLKITETENIIMKLKGEILRIEHRTKVAQTKLNNKNGLGRPYVENCRDGSLFSLLDEVKTLNECRTELKNRIQDSEQHLLDLLNERMKLENEITIKRKSLYIDRDRCQPIRLSYPNSNELSGFI